MDFLYNFFLILIWIIKSLRFDLLEKRHIGYVLRQNIN